jgi:hypothetical protein
MNAINFASSHFVISRRRLGIEVRRPSPDTRERPPPLDSVHSRPY